ncbi:MAG: hypothetical protein JWO38_1196 [Gemmataceae bacterium]|nr:hypothetical protein [Gemmataceae bacterium]
MSNPTFAAEDKAFLRSIIDRPEDITTWLVYADWLADRDDPRAEYLRLQAELGREPANSPELERLEARVRELCATLDPVWIAIVDRPKIENCPSTFAFRCPQKWEQLTPTRDETVRYCDRCREEVLYCRSLAEARQFADEGYCVAISRAIPRTPGDFDLGDQSAEVVELGFLGPDDEIEGYDPRDDLDGGSRG